MESILNYQEEELELEITEGVNDSGIFKAIVMAGGPGSGKSYVAKKLGLGSMGLRVINSDNFFELLLKKKGLSLKMPDNEEEEREAARFYAKALTSKRLDDSIRGRLGVLIDSTSGDVKKTAKIIQKLKNIDFRCFKFISDNADSEAKNDWVDNVSLGTKLFIEKISNLVD